MTTGWSLPGVCAFVGACALALGTTFSLRADDNPAQAAAKAALAAKLFEMSTNPSAPVQPAAPAQPAPVNPAVPAQTAVPQSASVVPAASQVDFSRDIRPIFAASCFRCHSGAKPRSNFHLDYRLAAIKGGDDNTNDIVPGDSTHSLLISYVSRQVKDMEMPPVGRGNPLTPAQIGLLRAWIDQGAVWDTGSNAAPELSFAFAPAYHWVDVTGDKGKYRELEGVRNGSTEGVDNFSLVEQVNPNEKVTASGHVMVPGRDIDAQVAVDRNDFGFVHAGFDEWRKYYNDFGGYDAAVTPPGFDLGRDLYLDNGRAWIDFGLTLPHRPQIVLGYEYQFRSGTESSLDWGTANGKNIYPATRGIDERTHIIKLDISGDFDGWHGEDRARVEFYRLLDTDSEPQINLGGASPDTFQTTVDSYHSVNGMNTASLEKQIRYWWFASGAFYYSRLQGDDFFNQSMSQPMFNFTGTSTSQLITLKRESEIFSVASLFTPLPWLNFSVGSQNEWTREDGFGDSVPFFDLLKNTPAASTLDRFKSSQTAALRFTKIPFTSVFADARLDQETDAQSQEESAVQYDRRDTADDTRYDVRTGFDTSPWRWLAWNTQVEHRASDTSYENPLDIYNGFSGPTNNYPGFILHRKVRGDDLETKVDLRPAKWLKTTFSYQFSDTEYNSVTDQAYDFNLLETVSPGGAILDGRYVTHTYGVSAMITPVSRFYFTGAFTYSDSHVTTADYGDPTIVPYPIALYLGHVYTVSGSANYALNAKTSLLASYNFTYSDYGENNAVGGLPLGLDFTRHEVIVGLTRKFTKRLSGTVRYEFSRYVEPTANNFNDFTANGVFASLAYRWP